MRIRILYFGVLKDAFGCAGSDVVLAEGASVADLLRAVRGSEGFWDSIAVAVNQEYAKGEDVLKDGDEVALLPPVSGGVAGRLAKGTKQRQKQVPFGDDKQEKQRQELDWEGYTSHPSR